MDLGLNIKYDFDTKTSTSVIQPPTQRIESTGTAVFLYGSSESVFNTATFGGELDVVYNTNLVGSGKTIALRVEDNSTNPTFTLDTALLEYRQNDRQ
jgi:hypothetical protein